MAIEGKYTTEYAETKAAGLMCWALMFLGAVVELAPMFVEAIPAGPESIAAGVILAASGAVLKGVTSESFKKGRIMIKKALIDYDIARHLKEK